MHRIDHRADGGLQQVCRLLGVHVPGKRGRIDHVGEQHRNPLALALERVPGAQDTLGKVAGNVALGRSLFSLFSRLVRRQSGTAAAAENIAGLIGKAAIRTCNRQGCTAFSAEAAADAIFSLALMTLHRPSPEGVVNTVYRLWYVFRGYGFNRV